MRIPGYVEERIRKPIPDGCLIVRGSTPVVAFGDATKARVATIGLNPSNREFHSKQGSELDGEFRRFETHRSLCISNMERAGREKVKLVLAACNDYFRRNPYGWFDDLQGILNAVGASYRKGTGCHLDLVQWATRRKWRKLRRRARERL